MEDANEEGGRNKDENYSFQQKTLFIPSCQNKSDAAVLQRPLLDHSSHFLPSIVHVEAEMKDKSAPSASEEIEKPDFVVHHVEETQQKTFAPHPPTVSRKLKKMSRAKLKSMSDDSNANGASVQNLDSEPTQDMPDSSNICEETKEKLDALVGKLNDDSLLIDSYENFLRNLSKEEDKSGDSDSKSDTESLTDSSSTDFSVSSLSESDEETSGITTDDASHEQEKLRTLESLYSLPMKSKRIGNNTKDLSSMTRNEDVSKYTKLSQYVAMEDSLLHTDGLRTMSAPNLKDTSGFRTLDTRGYMCPRYIQQMQETDRATLSSPELKKTCFNHKYRPLPSIPRQNHVSTEVEDATIYESIRTRDLSESSDSPRRANKISFKDVANRVVSLMPRLTTREARSREIDHHMADIARYLPDRKLRIFVGTWNMKGIKDLPKSLDDYLLPNESVFIQDIYAVGCQEGTPFRKEWEICLQETLGPTHVLMYSANFGVLQLSIFVRRELVWFCTGIEQDTVATRIAHKIKTKGAIAVSFNVFGTSLLFINSHFASDQEKCIERVKDYKTICHSLAIPFGENESTSKIRDVTSRFDRVFWFGDFNFRVNKTRAETDRIFAERSFTDRHERMKYIIDELLPHDQLSSLLSKGRIFHGFHESTIKFLPTYKFDVNTDSFDTSAKKRVPSWTDRVLYKSKQPDHIKVSMYNSCNAIKCSDHRPVYAILEADIEPIKKNALLPSAMFDREIYVEAHMRRSAPTGSQHSSNVCVIL